MSSIMETGLSCASRPALDDVAGPTRHSTAARKQAANGGGCPFTKFARRVTVIAKCHQVPERPRGGGNRPKSSPCSGARRWVLAGALAFRHRDATEFGVYALSLIVVVIGTKPEVLGSARVASGY